MNRIKTLLAGALLIAACSAEASAQSDATPGRLMHLLRNYAEPIGEKDDARVLAAMRSVPRHLFVPEAWRDEAYADRPLPIGEGQTISQPSLVALMTHLLRPRPGDVMLEVGAGSGYQAAILSRLVDRVYTIEIVGTLARQAAKRLSALGYDNVRVRQGDGYAGWPEAAPFDGIIVTAGAPHVPRPLIDQLKPGGRMVIPVGPPESVQELKLISKDRRGTARQETVIPVRFVPLIRTRSD